MPCEKIALTYDITVAARGVTSGCIGAIGVHNIYEITYILIS